MQFSLAILKKKDDPSPIMVKVQATSTFKDVKDRIKKHNNIEPHTYRLIHNGKKVDEFRSLKEYGLHTADDKSVYMVSFYNVFLFFVNFNIVV